MNDFKLLGSVKAVEESTLTLETESGVFKIAYNESLKKSLENVKPNDKILIQGKLEASKGIKLIAEKMIGYKRGV